MLTDAERTQYAALVGQARSLCGCYACCGSREIGAHTIQTPDKPRPTPISCLASGVLAGLVHRMSGLQAGKASAFDMVRSRIERREFCGDLDDQGHRLAIADIRLLIDGRNDGSEG